MLARLPELTDELVTRVRGGDEAYCTFVPADDHWQSTSGRAPDRHLLDPPGPARTP